MKTVVFGDIHGRDIWEKIVNNEENVDRWIFLGDYVSTHDSNITSEMQINNLKDILNWAAEMNKYTPGRVVLLRGNHDMQHLGYSWAKCSGLDWHVQSEMMQIKEQFLNATQWVYVDNDIVYCHAGITKTWMENVDLNNIEDINNMEPNDKFGFWGKLSDYYGDSKTQGPTWIRPWTLVDDSFGNYTYIVGHTTTKHITNFTKETIKNLPDGETLNSNNDVWTCDCLGVGEYLVVENGKIIPVKIEM
jgi:predicted phosphodiesterase